MRNADNVLDIDRRFAGEPCVRESGKHGSEGGGWKSVPFGKQLAGRLPYIWDCRFSEWMKSLLSQSRHRVKGTVCWTASPVNLSAGCVGSTN